MCAEDYPFLGASPDGIVTCDCCPPAVVEVKCSYTHRDKTLEELQAVVSNGADPSMCLDADMTLKKSHRYYTQVQGQLFVAKAMKCYFVFWVNDGLLVVDEVQRDDAFIQAMVPRLQKFVKQCLIPALICPHRS